MMSGCVGGEKFYWKCWSVQAMLILHLVYMCFMYVHS